MAVERIDVVFVRSTPTSHFVYVLVWAFCPQGCGTELRFSRLHLGIIDGARLFIPRSGNPLDRHLNKGVNHPAAFCQRCNMMHRMTSDIALAAQEIAPLVVKQNLDELVLERIRAVSQWN